MLILALELNLQHHYLQGFSPLSPSFEVRFVKIEGPLLVGLAKEKDLCFLCLLQLFVDLNSLWIIGGYSWKLPSYCGLSSLDFGEQHLDFDGLLMFR